MKNSFKYLIPIIATIGVAVTFAISESSAGSIIILFYFPLLIIYVLVAFRSVLKNAQTKLKPLFLSVTIFNTIVVLIYALFKTMHWPFIGPLKLISTFFCILTFGIGIVYVFINRKQISVGLSYEVIFMLFPALIFVWSIMPYNFPPQLYDDYVELISESNDNLEIINNELIVGNCQLGNLTKIKEMKAEIVDRSGGYEKNRLIWFYNRSCQNQIEKEDEFIRELDIKPNLKRLLLNVKINGDAIFLLTQIESELLVKKCN